MSPLSDRFRALAKLYTADEAALVDGLIETTRLGSSDHKKIQIAAQNYIKSLRSAAGNIQLIDIFLLEYDLSSEEGLTLMRLAEALIRTPDYSTCRLLVRDKLVEADWASHAGKSDSFLVNQATSGLRITKAWIKATGGKDAENLLARLGDKAMLLAVAQAMNVMGQHFVLGRNISEAARNSKSSVARGFTHSFDMLGEAAYTHEDAEKYFEAYHSAIAYLASVTSSDQSFDHNPGISIKLSALHPRYEYAQRDVCVPALVSKTIELAKSAKRANLSLTIDAEEADRLEVSLLIFEQLLKTPELKNWDGLGIAVQSYQRRASQLILNLIEACQQTQRKITVRLVKGAYWDMEIKRAQELGLSSYPVFTRKENTDISYIACARLLLDAPDVIFPQFATHNALTAATIIHMAEGHPNFEFQRLHGMGTALHDKLMLDTGAKCRVYAPVGSHQDLLPYLVRRLLENGANSSFVNQQYDEALSIAKVVEDPFKLVTKNATATHPKIPTPTDLFAGTRQSASGLDVTQSDVTQHLEGLQGSFKHYAANDHIKDESSKPKRVQIYSPADTLMNVGSYLQSTKSEIDIAVNACLSSKWSHAFTADERAACLERTADLIEADIDDLLSLCTLEAGKSYPDSVAEVREAVDFCRYYAQQARRSEESNRYPLGIIACISPWNFPLAIFLGQIVASLVVGNTVIAKPAEQTPLIAHKAVALLYAAGIPEDALHLILGNGATLGNQLVRHRDVSGVCFTGSTLTAKKIAVNLADTNRATLPFIAETGGINAMIVDSTALIEQAIQDVINSSFQSAGQRCSACRIVCVQEDIADTFTKMLAGAMTELTIGNPSLLKTDVGPVIDARSREAIANYVADLSRKFKIVGQSPDYKNAEDGYFVSPIALEIKAIEDMSKEVFGPVLHICRFKASEFPQTVDAINALGYGLTMGFHSRLNSRIEWLESKAQVGNLYVNRNQIGAVVGIQPFGGEGLSGTGPKAGGPHYLLRLSSKTNTVRTIENTAPLSSMHIEAAAPSDIALTTISNARKASKLWSAQFNTHKRRGALKSLIEPKEAADRFLTQFKFSTQISLPSPTGEKNSLNLHPRGVILCIGNFAQIKRQMYMALCMGNSVIVYSTSDKEKLENLSQAILRDTTMTNIVSIVGQGRVQDILNGPIDGVAVDGQHRSEIAEFLCIRSGAILPVLSLDSDLQRFCHERTVTHNTTAAGGNASLLTL